MRGLVAVGMLAFAGCSDAARSHTPLGPAACGLDEIAHDGGCLAIGVTVCGMGMEADGLGGCVPILPSEPCAPGMMSLPGDTSCQPIVVCGADPYAGIPIDATTQFVDPSFGGTSDGSQANPWRTIDEAHAAATIGAVIALAPGSHGGEVALNFKDVRLWGRCPNDVEIVSTTPNEFTLQAASYGGVEIHNVAIRGPHVAIALTGGVNLVEGVWVRDASFGIYLSDALSPPTVNIRRTLVENVQRDGVVAINAVVDIRDSEVRHVDSAEVNPSGAAIAGQNSTVTVAHCLIHDALGVGISSDEGILVVEDSAVMATRVAPTLEVAFGIQVGLTADTPGCGSFAIARSYLADMVGAAIVTERSAGTIDGTTVYRTAAQLGNTFGGGVIVQHDAAIPPSCGEVALRDSVVADVEGTAVSFRHMFGSVERVIVHDARARPSDGLGGVAVGQTTVATHPVTLRIVDSSLRTGAGVGVLNVDGDLELQRVHVRDVGPINGLLGDGVSVVSLTRQTSALISHALIGDCERAGISNFGSVVNVDNTAVSCASIPLHAQALAGSFAPVYVDNGGNVCGCDSDTSACKVTSQDIDPPTALAP